MKLIAIETSAEACSAALWVDGEVVECFEIVPRGHSERILPMADAVLAEGGVGRREIDAVAFGRGPGSFTGVRIAAGVAQGMAFGLDLPVVPVSSLRALAQGARRIYGHPRVLAAFDARMGEVYWGAFGINAEGIMMPVDKERVCAPENTPVAESDEGAWFGAGSAWGAYLEPLCARHGPWLVDIAAEAHCHAADVAVLGAAGLALGEGVTASRALPVYLRNQVAWKKSTV